MTQSRAEIERKIFIRQNSRTTALRIATNGSRFRSLATPLQAGRSGTGVAEGLRRLRRLVHPLQPLQGTNHRVAPAKLRTTREMMSPRQRFKRRGNGALSC
jgi:hypothetical protein